MTDSLITKYRPKEWDEVLGQDNVVDSLRARIEARDAHCILLVGPSGTGKTTLARIGAEHLGATNSTLVEVDAATYTGIDEMRKLTGMLEYIPLGGEALVIIVDECHRLSGNAWDSLLKAIEEPPDHVFWFFCTTNAGRVPNTVVTRSLRLTLNPVRWGDILADLLEPVAKLEKLKISTKVLGVCARAADGSPRQALANLAACKEARDEVEAAHLLRQLTEETEGNPAKLARMLLEKAPWERILEVLNELKDENPEGIRRVICDYVTKVALGSKDPKRAMVCCAILDNFSTPFQSGEGIVPVVLAVGRTVLL